MRMDSDQLQVSGFLFGESPWFLGQKTCSLGFVNRPLTGCVTHFRRCFNLLEEGFLLIRAVNIYLLI